MTASELKSTYLSFFKSKGHAIIKSASLLPENDPTVLFTTAGMHPLVPYLMGEKHPMGNRLADVQKCIRTQDIDDVGDNSHTTFFEMLGNWSLGDYFKEDAIRFSHEFLTSKEWLGIDPKKLAVTVFAGDADAPFDDEAKRVWLSLGIPEHKIAPLPKSDNWWGPAGLTGPCGPDTEMFYWLGDGYPPESSNPGNDKKNWMEIWNDVFMQYNKNADGTFTPLAQKNVDTGLGVERVACLLQGKKSVYDTELFQPIIREIERLSGASYSDTSKQTSFRVIADHLRAATFILGDDRGLTPSNVDAGYILRRYIRRSVRHGRLLGINEPFCQVIASCIIDIMQMDWPELLAHKAFILDELNKEEERFSNTLAQGLKEFEKLVNGLEIAFQKSGKRITVISGKNAFKLYDTYGFPLEMTEELAKERGLTVDTAEFKTAYEKHQELSRQGADAKFKGGLIDHSEETTRLHTATHLLHKALKIVLGDHANQKGSNITAERLRFDFTHGAKMSEDEVKRVEQIVNEQIARGLDVVMQEMSFDEAKAANATGLFESKYGERVKVFTIGDFSKEICGGPHVKNTRELVGFKIQKEESSSAGVRRIRAVLTPAAPK
ncbi:MAG: alanine--tRNA ligase [Spirochaetes bacterium]|nr:alanine--tRNA ligase [Spirochaetota bacterium]